MEKQSLASRNIHIEVPFPWLTSERDGERNRFMFDALNVAVDKRDYEIEKNTIDLGNYSARRSAPKGGFRLSYHSYGDARHVWRIKETPIPYFYSFDRLGFSGWSEIGIFPERFKDPINSIAAADANRFRIELKNWLVMKNLSKYNQNAFLKKIPSGFIFFPLQMRGDIVAKLSKIDPISALIEAAKQAKLTRNLLILKRHPYCTNWLTRSAIEYACLSNPYVKVSNASVHQLLSKCSSVLVANSGVGLEALVHNKPIHSFANSEYAIVANPIRDLSDIKTIFRDPTPQQPKFSEKFLFYFLNHLCFDARNQESIERMLNIAELSADRDIWCERHRPSIF